MKILLLVASPKELGSFDLNDTDVKVVFTGIGKLNAYEKTMQAIQSQNFDVVINIGTCGSKKHKIGSILSPNIISQGDAFISDDFESSDIILSYYSDTSILTGDNFISCIPDSDGGNILPDYVDNFDAFDMEAYAIARALFNYPAELHFIKIVSDNLDGSIKDWEKSADALSSILVKETESFIRDNFIKNYSISKKMKLADIKEVFSNCDLDIEEICENSFQNLVEETHYLTHSSIARFLINKPRGFCEIFLFYKKNDKCAQEKTILQALQRFETRNFWYKDSLESARKFDSDIVACLKQAKPGDYVIGCLTCFSWNLSYFDSLEEGLLNIIENDFYL